MSYWVYVEKPACEHCGRDGGAEWERNITSNVSGIVETCLVAAGAPIPKRADHKGRDYSWWRLDGWKASDVLPAVRAALKVVCDPARETELLKLQPSNGWGSLESVRADFTALAFALGESPDAVIRVSG